jgi:hypothetical protein
MSIDMNATGMWPHSKNGQCHDGQYADNLHQTQNTLEVEKDRLCKDTDMNVEVIAWTQEDKNNMM